MSASPKPQEPSMDELLASIRRIIADDEGDFGLPRGMKGREGADGTILPAVPARLPDGVAEGDGEAARPPAPHVAPLLAHALAHPYRLPASDRLEASAAVPFAPVETPLAPHPSTPQLDVTQPQGLQSPPPRPAERNLRETLSRLPGPSDSPPPEPSPTRAAPGPARPAPETDRMRAPHDSSRRKDLLSPAVDAAVAAAFESLGDLVLPQKDRTVEDLVKEILRPMLKEWLDKNLPEIVERLVRAEIERVSGGRR